MSATSGTWPKPAALNCARMSCRQRAATFGAVMRTISQPTSARAIDWRTVAAMSWVSLVVIDWMRTGFDPPTPTEPTITSTVGRRIGDSGRRSRTWADGARPRLREPEESERYFEAGACLGFRLPAAASLEASSALKSRASRRTSKTVT
jgi:hypothetical protein